ncbi:proteasome assembly chaperone 3 [Heterostelium album PN500]|uniref:Proteasome assembly chaperone 3 n=1 Tax=Heterostelium pallidum (strain ATCC 26659 / Pp 5 / PN500) TaxID=670386 RepID=D3BCG6_HETP5|nr:proteasome assembly chaperone 3 [Heterostelium album PN500]EFA80956.1 proteasome assembly chaperone 3 [Heterostelium album PN500]|eukprot:XP_020433074.1 proteasome assembly chaperone 3 [Heterostelium album PN500]
MSSLLIEENRVAVQLPTEVPVKTRQLSVLIDDVHTDIVLSSFQNLIFVSISQTNKFSTWIKACKQMDGFAAEEACFEVVTLLGSNQDTLLTIYARQLIENISLSSNKDLLLSIALSNKSKETFKAILTLIFGHKVW